MWADATKDPEFGGIFPLEEGEELPKVVILNPGKRKRYMVHSGDINDEALTATFDKIIAGDGKFTMVKGNELPPLN